MEYVDNRINRLISNLNSFTRQEFEKEMIRTGIDLSGKSLSRILAKLVDDNFIVRVKRNQYETIKKNIRYDFDYEFSDFANELCKNIANEYPLVEFQVWELTTLNRFLNHLLGHNCIFVEVESDLHDTIFESLMQKDYRVLYNPDEELFYRYFQDNMIIVRKLISQGPKNILDEKKISLERLLVDIVADRLLSNIISKSEIPAIYEECLKYYNINIKKMKRYALRRGAKEKIEEFIGGNKMK